MKNFFKNLNPTNMGKASLAACFVGAIVTAAGEVISLVRRDKRHKKLYATPQLKADEIGKKSIPDILEVEEVEEES